MQSASIEVSIFPDDRLDPVNAAKYIGLSPKTLAMMRCKGIGPKFIKPCGRIYYFRKELDAWLNGQGPMESTAQARHKNREHKLKTA